jgi:hypothetical protein
MPSTTSGWAVTAGPSSAPGLAWRLRRLRIRDERSSERFDALAMGACSVICFNALQQPPW